MSKVQVDAIEQQCGATLTVGGGASKTVNVDATTVTLGRCGGTVTLATGASQTGFGRTGSVNWDTTKKTTGFTAVSGNGYFCDTAGGAFTVTLPLSPTAGDIVGIADYAGTAALENITVGRNGSPIEGLTADAVMNINREAKTLVYVDGVQGWLAVNDNAEPVADVKYVAASGGDCTTTCGSYKIHTFTNPGTLTVSCAGNPAGSNTLDYLVVAGGGGSGGDGGGGGGAGGFRLSNSVGGIPGPDMSPLANPTGLPVTVTGYPVVVGGGGAGAAGGNAPPGGAAKGTDSVFTGSSTITSTGGGQTGCYSGGSGPGVGFPGGSGGGGSRHSGCNNAGGAGNTPPVSPSQGNNGGQAHNTTSSSGGGGGAGAAACTVTGPGPTQDGGDGTFVATTFAVACAGTPGPSAGRWFAGGGAAGGNSPGTTPTAGGAGGGGNAINSCSPGQCGAVGAINTGGGGGGGGNDTAGKQGGSGIVIIRYRFQ
tara:strand:+ start:267 stop:1709 length:1443 start_codon:yes stop_codon:yes gene_type:complete